MRVRYRLAAATSGVLGARHNVVARRYADSVADQCCVIDC
jgi:hypothetical protein